MARLLSGLIFISCCVYLCLGSALGVENLAQRPTMRIQYQNETMQLPLMKLSDLRALYAVNGGYIAAESGQVIYHDSEAIQSGVFVVPPTALTQRAIHPMQDAFFDRVRHREESGDLAFANTMRAYWRQRSYLLKTHFGYYVYFCNKMVQAIGTNPDELQSLPHPCGAEVALVARVGAEIETSFSYRSTHAQHGNVAVGPVIGGPMATMDFETLGVMMSDRKQSRKIKRTFEHMILDTGSEEVNLMTADFPIDAFTSAREVTNTGLHGSAKARFVTLRAKFAQHSDYRTLSVLLNDEPIEHRLVGMRFMKDFYILLGGPEGRWAAEISAVDACSTFLKPDEVKVLDEMWVKLKSEQSEVHPQNQEEQQQAQQAAREPTAAQDMPRSPTLTQE